MRVFRPLSIALLAVALALPAPFSTAQTPEPSDWYSLPYFRHDYGGWFRIWTNESTFTNGVRVVGASSAFNPYPGPTAEEQSTEFQALWADTCQRAKAQTFRTERSVYLMGAPEELSASLGAYPAAFGSKKGPIDWVKLVINGTTVYEVSASQQGPIPFDSSQRTTAVIADAPLQVGLNTFEVVGHKKKTKKSAGWCKGDQQIGIVGEVYGDFLADVAVSDFGSYTGNASGIGFDITVSNNGPSELIPLPQLGYQTFGVTAVSGNHQVSGMTLAGMPGCSQATATSIGGKSGYTAFCPLPRLKAGELVAAHIQIAWAPPYNTGATTDIYWSATGYGEDTAESQANNSRTVTLEIGEDVPPP
jgi:hypothetical protein